MTFAIGGLAYWMPDFLKVHGVSNLEVPGVGSVSPVTLFGGVTALAGLLATIAGGLAGDYFRKHHPGAYFLVSGFALILGFPMVLGVVFVPFPWGWIFVFLAVFCLFFNTGPTNAILANVTHPSIRQSGFALNILVIHALGDAISPTVIGWLADLRLFPIESQNTDLGFVVISLTALVGGVLWLSGARYLGRDTDRAPHLFDPEMPTT
jgi:hypothetical protein